MKKWYLKGAECVVLENIHTSTINRRLEGGGQKDNDLLSKGLGGGEGGVFKPNNPSWAGYGYFSGATQNFNLCEYSLIFIPKCQKEFIATNFLKC